MNVLLPPFCTLLAKLGRWGWLMMMRLAWKKSHKTLDTSKWEPKHQQCGQRTSFPTLPLSGTAASGMGRVVTPWRVLGEGKIYTQVHRLPHDCWLYVDPSPRTPVLCVPSRHDQVAFYDMQGEGASIITHILHGYTSTTPLSRSTAYFYIFWGLELL